MAREIAGGLECDSPALRLHLARLLFGWKAHATQQEWLLNTSNIKVAACGRRWGKTEAQAVDAATWAITHPGSTQMIVAPTYDQSRLIAGGVERLLLSSEHTRGITEIRKTPYPQISILGSTIAARTADDEGRGLRGHQADRVIVDEAAYVPEEVVTGVLQPMLADTDGQLILISTPAGRNYFWRLWNQGRRGGGRVRSFRFPTSSNPHISARYVEAQRSELPGRVFACEYLAQFAGSGSRVFPYESLRACQNLWQPAGPADIPVVVAGVDWARYGDYTACVAMDISGLPWRVVEIDRFQGLGWEDALDRVSAFLARTGARVALTDQTSIGDPLLERLRTKLAGSLACCVAEGLVFTAASKQALVDQLSLLIAGRGLALPTDESGWGDALLHELEVFEFHTRPTGSTSFAAPSGAHDDCVMALALAAWQAREQPTFHILTSSGDHRR